jgi:hypothetical protein
MAEERARTLDGFNTAGDRGVRSPSLSPFHGFPDQSSQPQPVITPSLPQGWRIPRRVAQQEEPASSRQQHDQYPASGQQDEVASSRQQHSQFRPRFENSFQNYEDPAQFQHAESANFNRQGGYADPDPGFRPQQAHPGFAAAAPLPALRAWFPLLQAMPDAMMVSTDLPTLMALNNSLRPDPRQGASDPMEVWAAMAAKFSSSLSKQDDEPGVAMARTLASLRDNPTTVQQGLDDRSQVLHPARFLGGAACPAKKLWRDAREAMPMEGYPPLANYDLTSIGLGGCVTARGFKEIHNPGSPHLTLKLFSSSNMGSSTAATRRLTLADNDSAVSIGDSMREVSDLNELKLAMRALCRAAQLILPWNMSFNAIDGFLHTSNYANAELNGRANRPQILTDFINYVLGLNAAAWVQKDDFLSSGEIKNIWAEWFGSRPASLLAVAPAANAGAGGSASSGGGGQGVAGAANGGGQQGGRGRGSARNNNQSAQPATPAAASFTTPPPAIRTGQAAPPQICRRYNYGNCPNTAATCALPSGTKLIHKCEVCNGNHARVHFH